MGRFVNPDNSAFQVILNSDIYIDKTELLEYTNKVLNTIQGNICNSRPRRFGKSITANMLTAYYSKGCDSEKMFSNLAIAKKNDFKKHLNKYDVIHLDIQWFMSNVDNVDNIVFYITQSILSELREIYPSEFLLKVITVPDALSYIKELTGQKFIVIIDEWDVLIRDKAANQKVQIEYINFLRGMFKGVEPTKYIQLAYLTGILPIKKEKTQSALNNFDEFTMLNPRIFAKYIGFTEEEVQNLCSQYECDFDKVKRWYDGYLLKGVKISESKETKRVTEVWYQVYNPKAVVEVLRWNEFQSYWSLTGTYEAIIPLINMNFDGLKNAMIEMISGAFVKVNIKSFQNDTVSFASKDDVLTYLIHLGYLAYNQKSQSVYIPNEEIRQELTAAVESTKWNEMINFQQKSEDLLYLTLNMDSEAVAKEIEKIHTEYVSAIQYNNENSLSSVLAIAYLSSMKYYFKPIRELPTGYGFADFVYIPKTEYMQDYPALVIELKWNKSVKTALQQIKEKKYPMAIEQYTGEILFIGISYDKKTKEHKCLIEKYEK